MSQSGHIVNRELSRSRTRGTVSKRVSVCGFNALPHQKSSPAVCSYGGDQELLDGFSADETGGGDDAPITSSSHCSSRVSRRWARIFRIPRWSVRICSG